MTTLVLKIIAWGLLFSFSGAAARLFGMIWDWFKDEPTWLSITIYFVIALSPVILKICGVF